MTDRDPRTDPRPGDIWHDEIGPVRVMAVAEGWMLIRRKGCSPLAVRVNDERWTRGAQVVKTGDGGTE